MEKPNFSVGHRDEGLWPTEAEYHAMGLPVREAEHFVRYISSILRSGSPQRSHSDDATWRTISSDLLRPYHPFPVHERLYSTAFAEWDSAKFGPPPVWTPILAEAKRTNVGRVMERDGQRLWGDTYTDPIACFTLLHQLSVEQPEVYWPIVLEELQIFFHITPSRILDAAPLSAGKLSDRHDLSPYGSDVHLVEVGGDGGYGGVWLPGAVMNAAECCLKETGVRGRLDDRTAIIWRDEGSVGLHRMSLGELRRQASRVAFALDAAGYRKGDAIGIAMPMTVEAVVIYLGIILAGCVVVSIPDSLAPNEIATRVKISHATAIFTQDVIFRGTKVLPLYSRLMEVSSARAIVVPANGVSLSTTLRSSDVTYADFLRDGELKGEDASDQRYHVYPAVPVSVEAFSNILFSSGTTGEPKAIPWTHATPIKAAADAWAHQDVREGDVIAWPTNLGWMMGPWLIYASLLNSATIAIFNGSPLERSFGEFVQDAKVTMLGLIPSIVKIWKSSGCMDQLDWSSIRCFSSTGEASNVTEYLWLMGKNIYKTPVIEYCGGTEIGGAFITGSLVQSQALAAFSTPAMGCRVFILRRDDHDDDQQRSLILAADDERAIGECALFPRMMGASKFLLNANHDEVYFKGMPHFDGLVLRRHGDEIQRMARGFYRAHGRVDDTMNLSGIKVSSVEIERTCNAAHKAVLETAAIGVSSGGSGPEELVIVAVLKDGFVTDTDQLKRAFASAIRAKISPLFKVGDVAIAPLLPRTASNKVMRRVLRDSYALQRKKIKSYEEVTLKASKI